MKALRFLSFCVFANLIWPAVCDLLPVARHLSRALADTVCTFQPYTLASMLHNLHTYNGLSATNSCLKAYPVGATRMASRSGYRLAVTSFLKPLRKHGSVNLRAAVGRSYRVQPCHPFSRLERNSLPGCLWENVGSLQRQVGFCSGRKPYAKQFATMESVPRVTAADPPSMPLTECYGVAEVRKSSIT